MLLKSFAGRQPQPKDIARLDNEYRIASQLDTPAVVRPIALEATDGMPTLVLEDFGGEPLERQLGGPMQIEVALDLAVRITAALAEVHRRGVIHKDINPDNILVDRQTGEVKLTEFGIASLLPREQPLPLRPSLVEGTLAYMAPEQTGRMNRPVDARSDLYSLGVVFYRMLTGRSPFDASDALEWIHCHIARSPAPPCAVVPSLPLALSDMALKLLAKDPEQRYQTAEGLKRDLERCQREWQGRGRIIPFVLGEHDTLDRLLITRTLYGRETELQTLRAILQRVSATGEAELVLVRGGAGIGKSSVVREINKHVIEEGGLYLEGKFEPLRGGPYGPILHALREAVLDIVAEGELQRRRWKRDLLAALAGDAKVIVDVIPELALTIGDQPEVPELPLGEAEKRFRRVFRAFIGVFARPDRPLVLFIDDLHWADPSSLALIEEVVAHPDTRNLLLIGAYRDNEVPPDHPLVEAERRIRESGRRVEEITLSALTPCDVLTLVAESIRSDIERARELAGILHEKTGGNPFFVLQMLRAIRRENLLWFDDQAGEWRWDISRIRALSYTNNVIDLLVRKLTTLPSATQEVLQVAACLGNRRSLGTLALATGKGEDVVLRDLWDAVREGLVVLTADSYAFVHDRMQQAAYSQIPLEGREAAHLGIGRLMREHAQPDRRDECLFDISTQLNLGASLIENLGERRDVAELDLHAGRKARAASAFGSALEYFSAGANLLDESEWSTCYELKYALELERAECEWLTGHPERARARLERVLARARNRLDKGAAAEILVAVHVTLGALGKDIEVALSALRSLGIEISPHPTRSEVVEEYEAVQRGLRELDATAALQDAHAPSPGSIERVVDLPPMTDPEGTLAMRLLSILFGPSWSDANLFAYHICKIARLSLEKGNSGCSVHGYGWYGVITSAVFHRYEEGYRWARAGYALMVRDYPAMKAKAEYFMAVISIWLQSLDTVIEHARAAAESGLDLGDITVASWCRTHVVSYRLLRGDWLQDVEHEATTCLEIVRKRGVLDSVYVVRDVLRYVRSLRGTEAASGTAEPLVPEDGRGLAQRVPTMICWHHVMALMTRFMQGDYEGAREAGLEAKRLLWASVGHVQVYDFHFYYALTLAALHERFAPSERASVENELQTLHDQLIEWTAHNPATFSAAAALVAAELARVRGAAFEAARGYEHAAELARVQGLVQVEALAYELAARFYRTGGIDRMADVQIREARDCYVRWGAAAKVARIESAHPHLSKGVLAPAVSVAFPVEQVDLLAVAKASQTISKEIVLDKVTEALLDVVLEQSGAQKGCLLIPRGEELIVEVEASPTDGKIAVTRPRVPATDSRHVPASVVAYAWETRAPVLLDNATQAARFKKEPYLVESGARSILCLPLVLHGQTAGLVYLENRLVAGAFTRDRLTVLELLAQQAAISLRNAQLLLEESVAKTRAEKAERRSTFLARAGALLTESLDYDSIPTRLARLLVGPQADFCSVQLLEDGRIQRVGFAHSDPERDSELAELFGKYPLHIDSALPGAMAIRTGAVQIANELSDEDLRRICGDDAYARRLRALGVRNVLAVPLVARGRTLGSIGLIRGTPPGPFDESDIELVQDLAYRSALALDNARLHRETQEAVRLRDEFLAVASHELNTPMTSLVLILQALVQRHRELSPDRAYELTKVAERQAGRLTRLIGELLDVTRIERGTLSLVRERIDLADLIREDVARFTPELEKARCTVSITTRDGVLVGEWDRSRLDQVVTNLLANAVKFGAGKPIEIVVGSRNGKAFFELTDHGIGIAPADQARIFDRYTRAVPVRHYGGLGLGLYICRQIVEAHGGSIAVGGVPGGGTTITVELPFDGPQHAVEERT